MNKVIDFKDFESGNFSISSGWIYCFNDGCKLKDVCLRRQTGVKMRNRMIWGNAVFPAAAESEVCPMFVEMRKATMAWGFSKALGNTRLADVKAVRKDIIKTMSNRRDFTRYNSGEWKLSEKQQLAIRRIFAAHGYSDIEFDHYQVAISLSGK